MYLVFDLLSLLVGCIKAKRVFLEIAIGRVVGAFLFQTCVNVGKI